MVRKGFWLFAGLMFLMSSRARAEYVSYHNTHPIAWMHLLPGGESPGWSSSSWFNLEINQANLWGTPFSMTDRRTGDTYSFRADYEQTSAIADFGWALTPSVAVAFEVPYANHNGGFLDDFIDQFHIFIQSTRFERNDYPKFANQLHITKNGAEQLTTSHAEGVGSLKGKLKFWLLKWHGTSAGSCDCGLAVSGQVKIPTQTYEHGLSSGTVDYTGMVNVGIPLYTDSGFWFSSAVTHIGEDKLFAGWPMNRWHQMYEGTLNLGMTPHWGFLLQLRYESPLFQKEHLDFNYTYTDPHNQAIERIDSGWNSLVYWRGSECVGFRLHWGAGSQIHFLFVEDWAKGKYDSSGGWTYINNQPDVEFITQFHFVF